MSKNKKQLENIEFARGNKEKNIKKHDNDLKSMLKNNPWLEEKEFNLDSELEDPKVNDKKQLRNAYISENKNLVRHINKRVEAEAGYLEEQCQQLLQRKDTVKQDKANLVETLDQCKELKEKTVMATFEKVNRYLDSIFSTLLPGTKARLKPVKEGAILEEGVELSVAFNGIWKNSLSELSGGQRSLLALSFILAMMKFKPAPIYILDEIDAALDLENTQNIGEMIRKHFKNSQFIIVSLKEQMTYNATVIFRVSNIDGKSKVERFH